MRTISNTLDALLPRVRQDILGATLQSPQTWWYLRDLAKHVRRTPSSLQRELARLTASGFLVRRRDGNRVYYKTDTASPLYPDLRAIFAKTTGLVDILRRALHPIRKRIAVAFVYGSLARTDETTASDADLMVIGDVRLSDLALLLRKAERSLGRPVNATVYTPVEFALKVRAGHHFLRSVLDTERLFVIGAEHELAGLAGRGTGGPTRHDQT